MTLPAGPAETRPGTSGLAVLALVFSCIFFVPLLPLIGIVLGIVAVARARPGQPRGIAVAAICVGGGALLFVLPMCAAVSIPAFMKYIRRAKTVEASYNLRRLTDATIAYVAEEHRLPPSTEWTPDGKACGHPGDRFPPAVAAWSRSPWTDLHFSVDDPHYYQYRFVTTPEQTQIQARSDLDCDGVYSHFERVVRADGTTSGGLMTKNEIE